MRKKTCTIKIDSTRQIDLLASMSMFPSTWIKMAECELLRYDVKSMDLPCNTRRLFSQASMPLLK